MNPTLALKWRTEMGLTRREAAKALGMSQRAYDYLEKGVRDGKPYEPDLRTALAFRALYHNLTPYS